MKLRVWQTAKEIAVKIYRLTRSKEFARDFGLKDQIQRSAEVLQVISLKEMSLVLINNQFVIFISLKDPSLN